MEPPLSKFVQVMWEDNNSEFYDGTTNFVRRNLVIMEEEDQELIVGQHILVKYGNVNWKARIVSFDNPPPKTAQPPDEHSAPAVKKKTTCVSTAEKTVYIIFYYNYYSL